jgi:hypothetical protein
VLKNEKEVQDEEKVKEEKEAHPRYKYHAVIRKVC